METFKFLRKFLEKPAKEIAKVLASSSFSYKDSKKMGVSIEI